MFEFRCVLEFRGIGLRKTYTFANKAAMRRYAAVADARIISIEVIEKPWRAEDEPILM